MKQEDGMDLKLNKEMIERAVVEYNHIHLQLLKEMGIDGTEKLSSFAQPLFESVNVIFQELKKDARTLQIGADKDRRMDTISKDRRPLAPDEHKSPLATPKQKTAIGRFGIEVPEKLTKHQASKMLEQLIADANAGRI